jgi:nucleoside-diphosphate-sugar epimerase
MKVLLTGATGFIGGHVLRLLLEEGHQVTAVSRGEVSLPPGVTAAKGDFTNPDSLGAAGEGADLLIHMAALITFDSSKLGELMRVNADGAEKILAAAKKWGVKRAAVVSSACTVGISDNPNPLDETNVPAPGLAERNPYMKSKLACEKAAFAAADSGLEVVVVNPTTVYGPGDKTLNSGALVSQIIKSKVIPVPPGGGNTVDVADAARGIILAAKKGKSKERYILGGHNLYFREIFSTVAEVTGARPLMIPLPRVAKAPMSLAALIAGKVTGSRFITPQIIEDLFAFKYYSSAKAERELGWKAQTSFRDSVSAAWRFYRENGLL